MVTHYVPARGDLVWLDFSPQKGHEQAGHRPAIIISPKAYNKKVGLALCCPITSYEKGYPFEIKLPEDLDTEGVILADQIKSLDWNSRNAAFIERVPNSIVQELLGKIKALI